MSSSDFTWSIEHSAIFRGFKCTPAEVSRRIRLKPTKIITAGEPVSPGNQQIARVSVWKRKSKEWKGGTAGVNAGRHLRGLTRLVETMHARRKVIVGLVPPGEFLFYSILYTNSPNVCIGLPLAVARQIADLNAEWTCSIWSPRRLAEVLNDDD